MDGLAIHIGGLLLLRTFTEIRGFSFFFQGKKYHRAASWAAQLFHPAEYFVYCLTVGERLDAAKTDKWSKVLQMSTSERGAELCHQSLTVKAKSQSHSECRSKHKTSSSNEPGSNRKMFPLSYDEVWSTSSQNVLISTLFIRVNPVLRWGWMSPL